ncbi:MAG: MBL fold metallo-hydrolase [Lachnospiraceae bacterium]|nr:MBL fold metallo-hydrolase [Lachnospiraceae bacterium]
MAETIKINENTWRIEDDGVRFFVFEGTEKAALIDTGMNTQNAREIAEEITRLPLILINTHADPDHIAGNAAFEEFYMSPAEEGNLKDNNGSGRILPVKEGDIIDLGERTLKIIDIPGHTPGSIAILDEKNRVLVSGDSVQNGHIFMFGARRNLDLYIESMKHLKEYDGLYDDIYAMHGDFPVKPELIDKLIEGATEIKNRKAEGTIVNRFGNEVCLYKFPYAAFLCEK